MSEKPAIDPRNLKAFNKQLEEYIRYNQRSLGEIVANKAYYVHLNIYKRFRAMAPTPEDIDSEIEALGYRVKRAKGMTVDKERRRRRASVKYLGISFLLADWRRRNEVRNIVASRRNRRNREIGKAIERTARGVRHPSVEIISYLEGAVKINQERRIIDQVLAGEVISMKRYVIRKQKEAQRRTIAKLNAFTQGVKI
jgi:hypothetical protein